MYGALGLDLILVLSGLPFLRPRSDVWDSVRCGVIALHRLASWVVHVVTCDMVTFVGHRDGKVDDAAYLGAAQLSWLRLHPLGRDRL